MLFFKRYNILKAVTEERIGATREHLQSLCHPLVMGKNRRQ